MPATPIPSKADVPAVAVREHASLVWASVSPAHELPVVPEAGDPDYVVYAGEPMDWACQSTRQIENFLDIAHFSVVHTDAFGNAAVMECPSTTWCTTGRRCAPCSTIRRST